MQYFKFFLLIVFLQSLQTEAAEIGGVTVRGEVAFDYNFLSSKEVPIPFTEGASNETYRMNGVLLRLRKEDDEIIFLSRLSYVPRQYSYDGISTTTSNFGILSQLEVFYKPTPQLRLGFGRFVTTMGYDSVMRYENSFYNNTIAYQKIVPGTGEGLRGNYLINDFITASVSTYNQFNYGATGEDYTPTKATEVSMTMKLEDATWFVGYLTGKDASVAPATGTTDKSSSDFWVSYKPRTDTLLVLTYDSLTLQPMGTQAQWVDATSAMAVYSFGKNNLGLRYEMIRGASAIGYGTATHVNVLYVSDKIKLTDHLNFYVEGRFDRANSEVFANDEGQATDKASMITLAMLAYF